MAIGTAIIYVSGVAWLAIAANLSVPDALAFGLWPFLPGDLVKLLAGAAAAAAGLAPRIRPGLRRARRDRRAGLMAAIVTEALTKTYPGHGRPWQRASRVRALHDLSIEVNEAEIFGFLGPNGSGKSTTIRLLLGFLHPTSGHATVLGRDITADSEDIRRHTGYLPGGIAFYDSMTGDEQLRYLSALDDRPAPMRTELVERMELSARDLRRQIRDYSRGMRQKIGIIQAFQHDPELAILDEPTEGLDPLMQRSFYEILDEREAGGPDHLPLLACPLGGRAGLRPRGDRAER